MHLTQRKISTHSCLILKTHGWTKTTQPFQRVDATVSLSSDRENQKASQDHLLFLNTYQGPAFTVSLLKQKVSIFFKFLHFKFFWKLWIFLFSSYCHILISPQLSGSVMCKWDTVPWLKLCGIERLFHMFCFRSAKTLFCGVCLAHNSTALLTHFWLPMHPNTYPISAILPSCSISLLYLWGCLALLCTPASLFIELISSKYPVWGFWGVF